MNNYNNFVYNPEIWGPHYWFFLHTIALTYPKYPNAITKKKYYEFFRNFYLFIPVSSIANEYEQLLLKYPLVPYLDDRKSLVKWIHFIHNQINKKLEKPQISMDDFIKQYYLLYLSNTTKLNQRMKWVQKVLYFSILVSLIILVYYLFQKK
jgi:hypothetical protein